MRLITQQEAINKSDTVLGCINLAAQDQRNFRKKETTQNICFKLTGQQGFTLIELVTVLIIVGVLAVAALPRFFDRNTFDSRGFYDQTISTLRYAQKIAIAQHRFVCVAFPTSGSIQLTIDTNPAHTSAACPGSALTGPDGNNPYVVSAPSGVSLSGYTDFSFNALGRPSPKQDILVSGYTSHIIVETETGYVH